MNFEEKNILITGASSGIGKELVKQLSGYSCNLFLIARRVDLLIQLKAKLIGSKCNIFIYECDVSSKEDVSSTYKNIVCEANGIDIAILNAGTSYRSDITKFNSENARILFNVNLMGIIYFVEQLVPNMLKNKSGTIIGVSSLADSRGYSKSGVYCASKAAATKFLEGLRVELAEYGVKVLTVKPGFVKTAMTDKNKFKMPFLMNVDKAVKIILKGIRKEKKIIQFPLPAVLGSKLIGSLPVWLYDFLSVKSKLK